MKKIKNFILKLDKKKLIAGLAYVFGLICFLCLVGLGFSYKLHGKSYESNLFATIFGGGRLYVDKTDHISEQPYRGGLSYFGIFSFIFTVAGIALLLIGMIYKNKKILIASSVLLILSGIFVLLSMVAGTKIFIGGKTYRYNDFIKMVKAKMGPGPIAYSIFAFLSGSCCGVLAYLEPKLPPKIKKIKVKKERDYDF